MEFDATFIIAAISFIIFTIIMNKIFYAPVMKIMEDREVYVASNYKSADDSKVLIKENITLKNEKLEETRNQGRGIISEKSNEAKQQNSVMIQKTKQDTIENITKMKEELVQEAKNSQEVLMANAVNISKEISHVVLGDVINTENITADKIKRINN